MRWKTFVPVMGAAAVAVALASWAHTSAAFDQTDSPETVAVPNADIVDVFAFPRPEDKAVTPVTAPHMILSMTVNPGATSATRFDPSLNYKFRLRPVFGYPSFPLVNTLTQADITCTFSDATPQKVTCNANGTSVTGTVGTDTTSTATGPVRIFAGLRSNPAFADVAAFQATVANGANKFNADGGVNSFDKQNVLALVLDVDLLTIFPALTTKNADGSLANGSMLAVIGETARN